MIHLAPRALPGTLLFRDWTEARALWDALTAALPEVVALCLMPDHVHVVAVRDVREELRAAASGYARWRNHHRSAAGPAWRPIPSAEPLADRSHVRRTVRYVHLNPCRAGLAADPLAWPFSTHRDAVGLAFRPIRRREPDPAGFHAWVSGDPHVRPEGTSLPAAVDGRAPLSRVIGAVAAVSRAPMARLAVRGPERLLCLRAAVALSDADSQTIATRLAVTRRTVQRADPTDDADLDLVRRVLRDPRFVGLPDGDLRPRWPERYASRP